MRKTIAALTLAVGFSIPMVAPAIAADLTNGSGQACTTAGQWHFVNNQTGGASAGTLTAVFSTAGGTITYITGPTSVLKSTQHFWVTTDGAATLVWASTDLPGRLQLSDFSCQPGGKDPKK
jgi:hypothetical protein